METFVITLLYCLLALPVGICGGILLGMGLGALVNWYRDEFQNKDW